MAVANRWRWFGTRKRRLRTTQDRHRRGGAKSDRDRLRWAMVLCLERSRRIESGPGSRRWPRQRSTIDIGSQRRIPRGDETHAGKLWVALLSPAKSVIRNISVVAELHLRCR